MKILIYGAGAVGLGIASFLIKSGEEVDIIAREDTVYGLREHGLVRSGIFGESYAGPQEFNSYSSLKDLPQKVYDYILVSTKSYGSLFAAQDLSTGPAFLKADKTRIILFQNGWGNAEIFLNYFPKDKIYNARVITGFRRSKNNQVDITVHADAVHIGSMFDINTANIEPLCESIDHGGMPCISTSGIEKDLWAKMLYNCALNPLGAILSVPYGALGEKDYTRNIMNDIFVEIFNVLEKSGYKTHWGSAGDYEKDFYAKFLPSTASHESSMLQDIRRHKRTEIAAMNGAVIQLGEKFGVAVSNNLVMYNMVKFIEET